MKKFVILFIVIIFSLQFAFAGEVNVSSFFGIYTGYNHIVEVWSWYDSVDNNNNKFHNLMFGISTRYGLSNKISDNFTLYFLTLFDLGLYINLTQEGTTTPGEIILGGEIKANYKKNFFGLGSGVATASYFFLRPSFGYNIKTNFLLDTFVDIELKEINSRNNFFRLGFTFSIFK